VSVTPGVESAGAIVLVVGDRYFARVSKGRILTAWHVAGAALFMGRYGAPSGASVEAMRRAEAALKKAGRSFERKGVEVIL
jgi:hypothetical protein